MARRSQPGALRSGESRTRSLANVLLLATRRVKRYENAKKNEQRDLRRWLTKTDSSLIIRRIWRFCLLSPRQSSGRRCCLRWALPSRRCADVLLGGLGGRHCFEVECSHGKLQPHDGMRESHGDLIVSSQQDLSNAPLGPCPVAHELSRLHQPSPWLPLRAYTARSYDNYGAGGRVAPASAFVSLTRESVPESTVFP
jgi:hypothetical protein